MEPNDLLLNLVEHLDAMVAYWDRNQVCHFANGAYRIWFGKTREQVVGHTMFEVLGPVLHAKNLPYILGALRGEKQIFEREIPMPGGGVRHSLATYVPNIVNGEVEGFFVHVADVTSLKRLERELQAAKEAAEQRATHDFLTGLPNRVLLMDRMSQAIAQAGRTETLIAVLTLDIDDFKRVNDTFGHGVGDALLVEVAGRVTRALREGDTVTRLGGDEFLLILQNIAVESDVVPIVERLLESMRDPVMARNARLSMSCSVGIAFFPRDGATPDLLIAASDRALYAAKALGKDRYAFAESESGAAAIASPRPQEADPTLPTQDRRAASSYPC